MNFFKNSFFLYILVFSFVLTIYSFRWSNILPPISTGLFLFFIISFIISFLFGWILKKIRSFDYKKNYNKKGDFIPIIFIIISFCLEFLYAGYIPLVKYLNSKEFNFVHFGGIPTFHVLLVSFTTFYSVIMFHKFLSSLNFKTFIFFISTLIPSILIFNRGMFFTIFFGSLFILIFSIKRINVNVIIMLLGIILYIFYLFGKTSNFRAFQSKSNDMILKVSDASEGFRNSKIPKEYIWSYMYICSPLGNLQHTIYVSKSERNFFKFLFNNICPDFLQNRFMPIFEVKEIKTPLISKFFNVSTFYGKAYDDLGYIGMFLIFLFQGFLVFFTILVLKPDSKYLISSLAILNTIIVLNAFSNVIIFSGISFQIVWILIFGTLEKYKFRVSIK